MSVQVQATICETCQEVHYPAKYGQCPDDQTTLVMCTVDHETAMEIMRARQAGARKVEVSDGVLKYGS